MVRVAAWMSAHQRTHRVRQRGPASLSICLCNAHANNSLLCLRLLCHRPLLDRRSILDPGHWIARMDKDKEAVLTEVKARAAKWWTQDDVGPKSAKFHFRQLQGAKRKAADDAVQSASKRSC